MEIEEITSITELKSISKECKKQKVVLILCSAFAATVSLASLYAAWLPEIKDNFTQRFFFSAGAGVGGAIAAVSASVAGQFNLKQKRANRRMRDLIKG